MQKVKACIGSAYGDEGKGMMVDYLSRTNPTPLVIRANGGAQVGHTVVRGDKRFVFSHMGSGTLSGVPTLFSSYSVVNPILFIKETRERNIGLNPIVFIDPDAPVTTPYDMILNQLREDQREASRHGSTGMGIGVTIEREEDGISLHYSDLLSLTLLDKIKRIKNWCKNRLGQTNGLPDDIYSFFESYDMMKRFEDECYQFSKETQLWNPVHLKDYKTLIFENGQGLLLDQEYGTFPHVTRSNTGFKNIGKFLKKNNLFDSIPIEIFYMTRCYGTRHGAGPFPYEQELTGITVIDETNKPNRYQGALRFAPLHMEAIDKAIHWDRQSHPSQSLIKTVVTCCDQIISNSIKYIGEDGVQRLAAKEEFISILKTKYDILNWSPYRSE